VLNRWKSRQNGADYPMKLMVTIPSKNIEPEINPACPKQELLTNRSTRVTYWERGVRINGTIGNRPIAGNGYVEMTGYARLGRPLQPNAAV